MFKHLIEGGVSFMLPVYVLYAVNLTLVIILITNFFRKQIRNAKKLTEAILFFGSLAFLIGLLGQAVGIMAALDAIETAGDVSLGLMAGGFKVTMIVPMYGFMLFILSLIVWFIFRALNKEANTPKIS
ncbi:MAG TPA: MotA/TolQ/ExbB proton channel family protein [Prolixibacteraceae bacterium]|nr:MotA/TolQ/ExbB proton channel family protein [Prolixibacteraceae bacterium]